MLYSASTNGFYIKKIHGDNIPKDAVEITDEEYQSLIDGQSAGKVISADANGEPVLTDRPPLTDEQIAEKARAQRDDLISKTIWIQQRHTSQQAAGISTTLTTEEYHQWCTYWQTLRDVPSQDGFPENIEWPTAPET